MALRKHPMLNAMVDGEIVKIWNEIHVGVAMDMGGGLDRPQSAFCRYQVDRR